MGKADVPMKRLVITKFLGTLAFFNHAIYLLLAPHAILSFKKIKPQN